MVLESLLSPKQAIRRPWLLLLLGFVYASLALLLSNWIFKDNASLVTVFLTVSALIPLFCQFMESEELIGLLMGNERLVLRQHGKVVLSFIALFIGMSAAFAFWYAALQTGPTMFSVQSQTIASMRQAVTGQAASGSLFLIIVQNNFKVLLFCVLFSFIYGAGAIFILTWNASVIGVALGNFVKTGAATLSASGSTPLVAYAASSGMSMLRYLVHGIPEITSYFVGGLAGGILSVAIVKMHWRRDQMDRVLLDVSDLLIAAMLILVAAAFIESFITPMIMR